MGELLKTRKCNKSTVDSFVSSQSKLLSKNQKPLVSRPVLVQAMLAINEPGDEYEQEADRVAEQVMRMPDHVLQSKCAKCDKDEEKILQAKESPRQEPISQSQGVPPIVHEVLRSPGKPLDPATRAYMEPRFRHDFSKVRVHSGLAAEQSAREVNALAYTVGHNIVFGKDRFAPETHEGKQLIAHELTHVVQQSAADRTFAGKSNVKPGLSPNFQMIQRKLECSLDHIEKECAGAAGTCMTVKDYCKSKYPKQQDIDKLHADAVKGANSYKEKFPNAVDNLLHFLDGSGTEKVMKVDIFRDHSATQHKYGEHMARFKEGAKKRFLSGELKIGGPAVEMVWTDTANAFSLDYNDLGLAVGGYTLCSKVSVKAIDPKEAGAGESKDFLWLRLESWTIQAFDCYNWDPGKGIGLPFATDNDLCCLENAGRAKHFRVRTDPWPLSFPPEPVRISSEEPPTKPSTPAPPKPEKKDSR